MTNMLILMAGLMAGIYFVFSVFVMKALAQLPAAEGARAMNRINDVIVKTLFLPLFFGSTLAFIWYFFTNVDFALFWQDPSAWAAVIYVFGMFFITVIGNVPMNNRLKDAEGDEKQLKKLWQLYLSQWTRFNHIRTISSTAATALLLWS